MHQVLDRDRRPVVRQLGHVLPHVVGERDALLFHQERNRRGRELLGDAADDEWSRGRDRHTVFQVGGAVTFGEDDFAVLIHGYRASGAVGREGREDVVDLAGQ
jgi:hypothetical protein